MEDADGNDASALIQRKEVMNQQQQDNQNDDALGAEANCATAGAKARKKKASKAEAKRKALEKKSEQNNELDAQEDLADMKQQLQEKTKENASTAKMKTPRFQKAEKIVEKPKIQNLEILKNQKAEKIATNWNGPICAGVEGPAILYVGKKSLVDLKEKLEKKEEISEESVTELINPEDMAVIMVPLDMRGLGEEFENAQQMVEKLGPKGTTEALVRAAEYFEANKDGEPEEERPKPMTAQKRRSILVGSGSTDMTYIGKKFLVNLKVKLRKSEKISAESVHELLTPENLTDDDIMVPVDMRKIGKAFDGLEEMIEELGLKGAAEAFIKSADYYEANKDGEPEKERAMPITALEWKRKF